MNRQDTGKRAVAFRQLIESANRAYYDEAQPFISDREFDEALAELNHLETTYGLETENSPTQRVGGSPVINSRLSYTRHRCSVSTTPITKMSYVRLTVACWSGWAVPTTTTAQN